MSEIAIFQQQSLARRWNHAMADANCVPALGESESPAPLEDHLS